MRIYNLAALGALKDAGLDGQPSSGEEGLRLRCGDLPISLFSIAGVWILLLGSRSPIRHYYRHRAPFGVLVLLF